MAVDSAEVGLHDLPNETLQQIASHLNNSHRPSLFAFGSTSKTCHSATLPSIFHHVHLTISTREELQRDIDALVKTLSRTESARHVRCLTIKGLLRLSEKPKAEGYTSCTADRHSWFKSTGVDEILPDEEPYHTSPHIVYDEPVIEKSSKEDMAWEPVVSLMKTIPHLTKLVYDCQNQFPPSLLDALHDHHPQCKLYHLTFKLRTLLWGNPYPYEMALATSPCLYSVKLACSQRDSEGDDDFNQEAMMELVAGLAPNLREVVVMNLEPENAVRYHRRPRESWRGLPGFVAGQSIGSLTSLSLLGADGAVEWGKSDVLQMWARRTDFSSLRHLALGGGYGCENKRLDGEMMENIAQNYRFPRLKTLCIRLERRNVQGVERPVFANNAVALFRSLEPLDELSVSGPLEPEILDAILDRHGLTLKKLSIRPFEQEFFVGNDANPRGGPMTFTREHILQIQFHCPALQELAVSIKRTKSDAREAEIYKSFGKMERLKSLFLILDCSDWAVTRDPDSRDDPSYDETDRETFKLLNFLKKGHLRENLMNCAVDETLARSIWETICESKVGRPLESLKLWPRGGGQWGNSRTNAGIPPVIDHLSRSWLIERVARGDKNDINVRELGRRAREACDQRMTDQYERHAKCWLRQRGVVVEPGDIAEDLEVVKVFRRIWPRKKGSKDWREDWSSLPLQV